MNILMETRLNSHQTHLDDLVLVGPEGLQELSSKLDNLYNKLHGKDADINVTTKIDGAPAAIIIHSFPGVPDGVCLKSFMNSEKPLVLTSDADIDAKYGDRANMAAELKSCLKLVNSIPEGQAWQGDALFGPDTLYDMGEDYEMQPNKIVYRVAKDSDTGKKLANKKFGIAFHTVYTKPDNEMKQSFSCHIEDLKNVPDDIFVMDANVKSVAAAFTHDEESEWENHRDDLYAAALALTTDYKNEYQKLVDNEDFIKFYFSTFENAFTSDKKSNYIREDSFLENLQEYVNSKINNEFDKNYQKLKTEKGKEKSETKRQSTLKEIQDIIDNNVEVLFWIVSALNDAAYLKIMVWNHYKDSLNVGSFKTFLRTVDSYEPTSNEGMAVSDNYGNIVKIVDKATFSNANRDPRYLSGFDHPENKRTQESLFESIYSSSRLQEDDGADNPMKNDDWYKVNEKKDKDNYAARVINNLLGGEQVALWSQNELNLKDENDNPRCYLDQYDFNEDKLRDILKKITSTKVDASVDDFNAAFTAPLPEGLSKTKTVWRSIRKGMYSNTKSGINKGNAYENDLFSLFDDFVKSGCDPTLLDDEEYSDVKKICDAIGYYEFNSVEHLGTLNQKRHPIFTAKGITFSTKDIGSVVTDITLNTNDGPFYLSIKYGSTVTFINAGIQSVISHEEMAGGHISNANGRAMLEMIGIDPDKFVKDYSSYGTNNKQSSDSIDVTTKLKSSKAFSEFILSVIGYNYVLVHKSSNKNGHLTIKVITSEDDIKKMLGKFQSAIVQYPSSSRKRIDVFVEFEHMNLKLNVRSKDGGLYPTHIMSDYEFKE